MPLKELLYAGSTTGYFHDPALQTGLVHQPGDAVFAAGDSLNFQGFKNPWTAIGLIACLMDTGDLFEQGSVGL